MSNQNLCIVVRNIIDVFVGVILYFIIDTAVGIVAGVLLNNLTQLKDDTIYFQIVLRFIVAASNARLITLVANHIVPRNSRGYNISEYIISAFIIVSAIVITAINWNHKGIDINNIIFCIFNLILGTVIFLDAKEELM